MLSRERADDLANSVVKSARAKAFEEREHRARGVPLGFRVAGITCLPRAEQDELLRQAFTKSRTSPWVLLAAVIWALICISILLYMQAPGNLSSAMSACISIIGASAIMYFSVRRALRQLLQARSAKLSPQSAA